MRVKLSVLAFVVVSLIAGALPAFAAEPVQRPNIRILSNADFTKANGVRSGNGTSANPYVISGWNVTGNMLIENTSKHVVIHDNVVGGQLILDWIGAGTHVHHNRINDLRVNRNRQRTGAPTSGEIMHNSFVVVGQLRHFDGAFEHNLVGRTDNLGARAVNFDGFNGASFRDNVIYGYMDARLHGHHHSSDFGDVSHMHSSHHGGAVDHSQRYHQVFIKNNVIRSSHAYALAYLDTNHAGNDRTAPSEQEPSLNKPHVHYTRAYVSGNRLSGAGLRVDVFNAQDQLHEMMARGRLELTNNRITLAPDDVLAFKGDLHGIDIRRARWVTLRIAGNVVKGQTATGPLAFLENWDRNSGIYLHELDRADVSVIGNTVANRFYGVRAEKFTPTVRWSVDDLETVNVDDGVYYDKTAAKPA